MSAQKNAPGAGGNQPEGENTPTPDKEQKMNNNQTTTEREYAATDVAAALAMIDHDRDVRCIDLTPDDALWQDIPASFAKPLAWHDAPIGMESGSWSHMVLPLDPEGRKTVLPSGRAWINAIAAVPTKTEQYWRKTPNSAIRIGDLLVISLGEVFPLEEIEVDGERMVEMVTLGELRRREKADKLRYADEHPEIRAGQPAWADRVEVDFIDASGADVIYSRDFGVVSLSRSARFENGNVQYDDDTTAPAVFLHAWEDLSLEQMRETAAGLMAAIPMVEAAQAEKVAP